MRKLDYLSPTSLRKFYDNRDEFYMEYLCDIRKKRAPQTAPMSVGSAFDAYVKSHLHELLIGKDPKFSFDALFEAQVEPHNRTQAKADGKIVYDHYMRHGGLADLILDLQGCIGKPRFESSIHGPVECVNVQIGAVPFLGKPDIYFLTQMGARIIFDWKTTGFYAKSNYSPTKGYICCLPKRNMHKDCQLLQHQGFNYNAAMPLDTVDKDWADQLSIYAWLLGQDVGSKYIVAIDEICCNKDWMENRDIRVAKHRALVSANYQYDLFKRAHKAWYLIQGGHIFDDMPLDQSNDHCKALDARMKAESGPKTEEDLTFDDLIS